MLCVIRLGVIWQSGIILSDFRFCVKIISVILPSVILLIVIERVVIFQSVIQLIVIWPNGLCTRSQNEKWS
jgi:hypothetical protein